MKEMQHNRKERTKSHELGPSEEQEPTFAGSSEGLSTEKTQSKKSGTIESGERSNYISETFIPHDEIILTTCDTSADRKVFGTTILGRAHKNNGTLCQDYHIFKDLGDGWQVFIVSDGAGSASQSHRGSKMNCELGLYLTIRVIERLKWNKQNRLPSEVDWSLEFYNICKAIKQMTADKIDSLDENVRTKDFNATFMLMIVCPYGLLCGHIGDGRMGYRDFNNNWKPIIKPHKGDEPNQTVFMMNEWDKIRIPMLRMSDVLVPESVVIAEKPTAVAIITDGCENASWNCIQFDNASEKYVDVNTPFEPFWNNLIDLFSNDTSYQEMVNFIVSYSKPCLLEEDDRTLMLGIYNQSGLSIKDETIIHSIQ